MEPIIVIIIVIVIFVVSVIWCWQVGRQYYGNGQTADLLAPSLKWPIKDLAAISYSCLFPFQIPYYCLFTIQVGV